MTVQDRWSVPGLDAGPTQRSKGGRLAGQHAASITGQPGNAAGKRGLEFVEPVNKSGPAGWL